jgi:diguanylate cyclase (GGDEF)-like protein
MANLRLGDWRFSSRVLMPITLAVVTTTLIVACILLYATRESDQIERERQGRLVTHILAEQVAKIPRDQQSVTIWDESIREVKGPRDPEWMDNNLGVWLHGYFGHDRVFVLDEHNGPIYAMVDGERRDSASYTSVQKAVSPLVDALRRSISEDPAKLTNDATSVSVTDLGVIDGRPAIASVVPIVSDSGNVVQEPGSEYLHVSIRFLDGTFLDALMQQYLIEGARFAWTDDTMGSESAIPLKTNAGGVIGYFVWQPDRPGWRLLMRTAPVLALAFLVATLIIALLVRRLHRASRELQASEAQAQHLAFHDPLTGLANRALFNDRLDRALTETRRTGSPLAVLYLDLDRFKNVNDTLGHPAGDDLIREFARRLAGVVRHADFVARLGGDEFAIIQTGVNGSKDAQALSERIIQAVSRPFDLLGSSAFVGVSIGVSIAPDAGVDRSEIVRKADIALYRAKLEGRNRCRIFSDEMDSFVQRRRAIETELRQALEAGDQLEVVYQPLYAATNSAVIGVEALLRWNHPTHGSISPAAFVPIAEESGLIHAIGDSVLRQACTAAARWPIRRVAVNVSPVQFRSPQFAGKVLELLRETGLEPNRLELEITESVLLDIAEDTAHTLRSLRAAGVRIALDDFGTGYSSLSYLHKYPVDKIKIDRSFVQSLDSDTAPSDAIIRAIVQLARAMRIDVTAEGVETERQRDFLREIGCNELQGFLLSRPLPKSQIERLFGTPRTAVASPVADAA